jgi:ketopantoate reductase
MKPAIVIIGVGEMGGVFARGFLRYGHPVFPVTRLMDIRRFAAETPDPLLVLVAVGEDDLHPVLDVIPEQWQDRLGLLQNELLPRDWQAHDIPGPTVISVWFEKKKGQDHKVLIPSPIYGPQAEVIHDALATMDIPSWLLTNEDELLFELVRKNVYILTSNIAGLVTGGSVAELWDQHNELALEVANEVMDIQDWLTGTRIGRERLIAGMVEGFEGDPAHRCTGRSAPARLARALRHADEAGLTVPRLREIHAGIQAAG